MKTLKKRVLSSVMAGALAVSMAVPAFASNTQITGTYEEIPIDVVVPETGEAQINPYGLPIKLDTTNIISGEQIVTKPLAIINKSQVNLTVGASVTATVKGTMKLAAEAPAADDTSKSAFVYLQMMRTTLAESDLDATDAAVSGLKAASINPVVATWAQDYDANVDVVLNATRANTGSDLVILKAASVNASDDTKMDVETGGIALFRLAGKAVEAPREAWTSKDGFTAAVAFTFKPDTAKVGLDKTGAALTLADNGTLVVNINGMVGSSSAIDPTSVRFSISPTSKATVAQDATDKLKATITGAAAGEATLTVEASTKNGGVYSTDYTLTVTAH